MKMNRPEKSDYHSMIKIEHDDVERVMKESKEFVMEVKSVLSKL
ncbi:MAG: hypothetical protein QME42_04070 [bacterium]|nr:hypothetical protein [bacterium]